MTEKQFKNVGDEIHLNGEVWCVAGGKHCADVIATALNELLDKNEQLKQLLREVEHELTSLTGLSCFDKCASQLGYVEVFDEDMWELDYSKLLTKIEKEL